MDFLEREFNVIESDFDAEYEESKALSFHEALFTEWTDIKNGKMKSLTF